MRSDGRSRRSRAWTPAVILGLLCILAVSMTAQAPDSLADVLARVSDRVQQYYSRAQAIVCLEKVVLQQIRSDLAPDGFARVLEYELRVEWEPAGDGGVPDATVRRELKRVNGRAARPGDEPKCTDPTSISPEPLAFMLPGRRDEYVFSLAGLSRDRKRPALMLKFQSRPDPNERPEVTTKDDCTSFRVPVVFQGQVWLDPTTNDILRVDQWMKRGVDVRIPRDQIRFGMEDSFQLERSDSSVRYRSVTFHDPDETVLLPESITSLTVVRGGSHAGHRKTQTFSDYKRFVTAGRIVK
jgi:hypothetical protein